MIFLVVINNYALIPELEEKLLINYHSLHTNRRDQKIFNGPSKSQIIYATPKDLLIRIRGYLIDVLLNLTEYKLTLVNGGLVMLDNE